ncbi:MAG TPA: hypothetical protein VF167_15385 [Longimicrobiaceae bacterium]
MTKKSSRSPEDMISEALSRLPPNNYEAAEILGVSEGLIRGWRAGQYPKTLRADTRKALEAFLAGVGRSRHNGHGDGAADHTPDATDPTFSRVLAEFREIDAHPDWSERSKLLRREHVLAAMREVNSNREARAAEIRARAIELEAEAVNGRARPRADELSSDRVERLWDIVEELLRARRRQGEGGGEGRPPTSQEPDAPGPRGGAG